MRKKRASVLTGILLAACGAVSPTLAAGGAPAAATSLVPRALAQNPALQALAQKMAHIRFNTARVSVRSVLGEFDPVVGGELAAASAGPDRLITTTSAVLSYSPRAFAATGTVEGTLGKHALHRMHTKFKERLIGGNLYLDTPSLASTDGGRPWVRTDERAVEPRDGRASEPLPAIVTAFSPLLKPVPRPSAHGTFAGLSEMLRAAQNVHEVASLTPLAVDGQSVSGFTASIPTAKLLARRASHSRLWPLVEPAKPDGETVALEVFIAPSGLPVRTTFALAGNGEGVVIQEDVLALEVPVVVEPPPANRTITRRGSRN